MSLEKYKQVIHEDFTGDADSIDKMIKSLSLSKDSKILDIGTGLGAMSILVAINGFDVLTGQPEKDPEWEEHEHEFTMSHWEDSAKAVGVEDKIKFQYLDAENLDFPDESFHGIFMYDTLQHVKNRATALNECLRVIKPDGLVCVIEWNEKSIKETEEEYGFTIDYINPEEILNRDDISVELVTGNLVNMFIMRRS